MSPVIISEDNKISPYFLFFESDKLTQICKNNNDKFEMQDENKSNNEGKK